MPDIFKCVYNAVNDVTEFNSTLILRHLLFAISPISKGN